MYVPKYIMYIFQNICLVNYVYMVVSLNVSLNHELEAIFILKNNYQSCFANGTPSSIAISVIWDGYNIVTKKAWTKTILFYWPSIFCFHWCCLGWVYYNIIFNN